MNEKLTEILDSVLHSPPAHTFSPAGPRGLGGFVALVVSLSVLVCLFLYLMI